MSAPWRTSEQLILIDEIRRRALAASEVCLPGRTAVAVRRKAARLRLVGDGIPRRPWSDADRATLRQLRDEGWTVARMCAGPLAAYSPSAVRKQVRRLGLADPRHVESQRRARRLTGPVLDAFLAFLAAHARACTPEQIANAWNDDHAPAVTRGRVIYHLKRLGLCPPRRLVIRMAFSKDKRLRSRDRSVAPLLAHSQALSARLERRLRELADSSRDDPAVRRQPCRDCGERWPGDPAFFHAVRRTGADGEPRVYLLKRCRLCCNRARRERDREPEREPGRAEWSLVG